MNVRRPGRISLCRSTCPDLAARYLVRRALHGRTRELRERWARDEPRDLRQAAHQLGDLLDQVVFVGGFGRGLLGPLDSGSYTFDAHVSVAASVGVELGFAVLAIAVAILCVVGNRVASRRLGDDPRVANGIAARALARATTRRIGRSGRSSVRRGRGAHVGRGSIRGTEEASDPVRTSLPTWRTARRLFGKTGSPG
jgi:hypothetical protein